MPERSVEDCLFIFKGHFVFSQRSYKINDSLQLRENSFN